MNQMKTAAVVAMAWMTSWAYAGTITTPHLAGAFNAWNEAADPMIETAAGSDVWEITLSGLTPDTRTEFKVTDGTWGLSLPGANSWGYADSAGNLTVTYDGNSAGDGWLGDTDRLMLSTDPGSWTAVGNWQNQAGGADWDNASASTSMTADGGGIYSFSTVLAPGDYLWKGVVSGTWDAISGGERSVGSPDGVFSTSAGNDQVTFYVNAYDGTTRIEIIPEPATLSLILLAVGVVAGTRRRRT